MTANTRPSAVGSPLSRPFWIAVGTVLFFGLAMQALLIGGVVLAERTLDRGVAPMQELLMMQRQAHRALQAVKQFDRQRQANCTPDGIDDICELSLLLRNIEASARRLLEGQGGVQGLQRSRALTGEAWDTAIALRDRAQVLQGISDVASLTQGEHLLQMQSGLLDVSGLAQGLERLVLSQLQADFHNKRRLDTLAVAATGVLMAATLIALFWMGSRVRKALQAIEQSEARLRAYADAVPDTAYILDSEGTVMEVMGRHTTRSDRPAPIPVGQRLQDHRPPELVAAYMRTIRRALGSHEVQSLETQLQDAEGELRWFEARVAEIELPGTAGDEGERRQVIWLSREVTGRIQSELQLRQLNEELEQRVAERTRELNDAAEELRRFNYTVSHDLRAPLRAVEAYTALAMEEAGESLTASARDLLERSRKSAAQLSHMVESLLQLSRIGEIPLQCAWLDLSAMVSEICMAFAMDQKEHRIEWDIEPGLIAWGDEHLMRSVLQNLVSNAVKYSSKREPAAIAFGQAPQPDGTAAFFIRDNGAGFDMAHASQLFQPFSRLHSAKAFPGDGIGLATVRRIVLRHGGRIWAQGQVNAGATVYFTLPPPARERDFTNSRPAPLDFAGSRPAPLWPDIET